MEHKSLQKDYYKKKMIDFTIKRVDFSISLISSMKFLLQIDRWHNHRSIMPIISDLLLLSDRQRYLINYPQAVELWCQLIIQLDQINVVLSAIKNKCGSNSHRRRDI